MLNSEFIRNNAEKVKRYIAAGRSKPDKADVDKWLKLDEERRQLLSEQGELNRQKNELAKLGKSGDVDMLRTQGKELKEKTTVLESKLKEVTEQWQQILDWMPNIPVQKADMPFGNGEEDNMITKAWLPETGELKLPTDLRLKDFDEQLMPDTVLYADQPLKPRHHLDLGTALGVIDNEQGAKVSGTRFTYIREDLARMQYALQQLVFAHLFEMGFQQIIPPLLLKERSLYGTSHIPEGRDQIYKIESEFVEENQELYLVGSSEPSNFSYFMDKTVDEAQLPYRMFAYTSCFRSEAGSWGRDTKGIKRLHQFDKIEMNVVCTPEQSAAIFDELLSVNEWLLQTLKIPYRLVLKCTGDAGYHASAKQIDPEAWLSGQQEFMEVGTDTNTTDFQARRLNIKYKTRKGDKEFAHTVNDTGVAMGRMLIAIMDNYQQADGTILIPEVLQPYMGGQKYIGK